MHSFRLIAALRLTSLTLLGGALLLLGGMVASTIAVLTHHYTVGLTCSALMMSGGLCLLWTIKRLKSGLMIGIPVGR
jgi:hypothetical protein